MHPYSVDTDEHVIVAFGLALLSLLPTWGLQKIFAFYGFSLPWYVCAPSTFTFYFFFWLVFNRWLWKWQTLHTVGLIKTPDISGAWHGFLQSSYDKHKEEPQKKHEIYMDIYQTWTKISLILRANSSSSKSEGASLNTRSSDGPLIVYQYLNEPGFGAPDTMAIHRGTTLMKYDALKGTLNGDYYTGRGRENYGMIHLEKGE